MLLQIGARHTGNAPTDTPVKGPGALACQGRPKASSPGLSPTKHAETPMASDPGPLPAAELERLATERTGALLAAAAQHYRTPIPRPLIRFDLRGRAAGQVRIHQARTWEIRYNPTLLAQNPEDFLAQTLPHEVAHLVVYRLFGRQIRPHGPQWRAVMTFFGAPPERCHRYDLTGVSTRSVRRYDYRCGCRVHRLSSIRHNRIGAGGVYLCRHCGEALTRVPEPRAAGAV